MSFRLADLIPSKREDIKIEYLPEHKYKREIDSISIITKDQPILNIEYVVSYSITDNIMKIIAYDTVTFVNLCNVIMIKMKILDEKTE